MNLGFFRGGYFFIFGIGYFGPGDILAQERFRLGGLTRVLGTQGFVSKSNGKVLGLISSAKCKHVYANYYSGDVRTQRTCNFLTKMTETKGGQLKV